MDIPVGTPCWIIGVEPGNESYMGRVVEVVAPAVPMADRGGVPMHWVDAAWFRAEKPGFRCYIRPAHLRPITPPGVTHGTRTDEPVTA